LYQLPELEASICRNSDWQEAPPLDVYRLL